MLKIKESQLNHFFSLKKENGNCKDSNIFWYYLFDNLLQISSNNTLSDILLESCPNEMKEEFENTKELFDKIESLYSFSLNENLSSTHLTPFHLSFLKTSLSASKKKGQFYTPYFISDFIANKSYDYFLKHHCDLENETKSINNYFFGDIACGSGNLIIPLLNKVKKFLDGLNDNTQITNFISNNIYCFDIDPMALWLCKVRMLFFFSFNFPKLSLPDLSSNLIQGNSLSNSTTKNNLLFDFLILNPPYMCYGLRNSQEYTEEYKKYLREKFYSAEYKLSLYPIFIERSLELLKNDGILGIITPDSYLIGRYYSKIRSFILDNSNILDITLLGFEPFKGVTLGRPTITFFKKNTQESRNNKFLARWIESYPSMIKKEWIEYTNSISDILGDKLNRFYIFFSQEDEKYVKKWLKESSYFIQDVATIHTGVRSRIGKKSIISKSKKGTSWKRGIISGSQVKPFYLDYQNHWLNVDPSILWSGGFSEEIVENPKIILRQTGYQVSCCVDIEGYYHLNNCHSLSPKNKSLNLYALAVVLNSPEFNRLYNILSIEKGRSLAQIDIEFLLKFPLIKVDKKTEEVLEEFYFEQNRRITSGLEPHEYSINDFLK